MASLRALTGCALMTLRAGLALKVIGCLVNGLMPSCSCVAGLVATFNFTKPGITNSPFVPSCSTAMALSVFIVTVACFLFMPVFSLNVLMLWDLLILLPAIIFLLGLWF